MQLSVALRRSKLRFDFLKILRGGFCTNSGNSDWKHMCLCDKYHSNPTIF